jgi:4'-phosphopantetheinyl transferase
VVGVEVGWLALSAADVPPTSSRWLSPTEAARATAMTVPQRQTDFLLGRWTAKVAVAAMLGTTPDGSIDIVAAGDGAPQVEVAGEAAALTLSITHRAGMAVALVDRAGRPVGCDLELVEPRTAAFVTDYLTEAEQVFATALDTVPDLGANLVWSAKESVLKVTREGLRRPTHHVEITVTAQLPAATGGGWVPYSARLPDGRTFPGWWRRLGGHVLTVAYDGERPPPEELSRDG